LIGAAEHLDWLDENVEWLSSIPETSLSVGVPACPGWTVDGVLTHLAYGLGRAYPHALATPADAADDTPFAAIEWPSRRPIGSSARRAFVAEFDHCRAVFRSTEAATPCWTYAGPGTAGFWFRRAAIETTLHAMDVADALGSTGVDLDDDRAFDAVAEAVEFALPFAADTIGRRIPAIRVEYLGRPPTLLVGDGPPHARIAGSGSAMLAALWGRPSESVRGQRRPSGRDGLARSGRGGLR
jgi:uncharacterized protein (TIGR03083 family)